MKAKFLRLLIVMTISITALFALGMTASAETVGAFEVTGGAKDVDYTYADGVLTINTGTPLTIKNTAPSTPTTDTIVVADDVSANITLDGVNIDVSATRGACAFKIADNSTGDVTIILADNSENTLKSGTNCAGLQKNGEYSDELGTLTIQDGELGTGKLTAQGGQSSAGIGGGDTANILIKGGNITAKGAGGGVGIGGYSGNKNIEISGGVVHASTAEDLGLTAIGSVFGSVEITISGGTVTTVSGFDGENGGYAPDIGSVYGSGSIINITGGSIKINSGNDNPFYGITPTDGNGNNVYLLEIDNPNNEDIIIDGVDYPDKHSNENRIYAYLPNDNHIVEIGDTTKYYIYKDGGYQCYNNYADIWMDCERYSKPYDGIEIYTSEFTVHLGDEDITDNENIAFTFYDSEGTLLGSSPVDVGEYTVRATYDDGETFGMAELEYEIVPGPLGTINIFGEVGKTLGEVTKEYIPEGAPEPADPFAGTFAWADGLSDSTVIVAGEEYEWTFTAQSSNYAVLEGTFITYGDISDPTDLTATGGEGKVTLNWTSNSTEAAPYEAYSIYVFTTMENAEAFLHTSEQEFVKSKYFMDDAGAPVTSYEIDKLASGTTYYFVLMADPMGKQAGTTSNQSVYATAPDGTNVVSATTAGISAPTDLTATDGEGKVTLNWTSNSTAAAPYEAYSIYVFMTMENAEAFLHTSEQKFVKFKYFMDDADAPVTSYEIDKLASGTTYYFVLMADPMGKQEGVTSDHSVYATAPDGTNIVSATTAGISAPTDLTATGGKGKVTLNWTSNSTAAAPYEAYSICVFETMESAEAFLHTSEQEFIKFRYFMDDAEDPITSYEIDGLSAGTTYYFVLMADPMGKQEGTATTPSMYATASDGTNVVSATTSAASSGGSGGSSSSGGGSYGGGGSSSYVPENPEIGGKPANWTSIANDISKLTNGSEATIELNGNYDVPVSVIKAIAEKDMKVTFVIDSTKSWIIDGAEIEDPAAADLKILTIASVNTSALRGDVGAKFRIDGTNAPTELEITFAKKNEGKFANLYKKDGDKLVFVDNARVDENGKVILSVSEKGDYVIMLCEFSDRRGDVSNDGIVTPKDASSILKDIVALEGAANPVMLDYNGDGVITPKDASDILKDLVFDVI